MADAPSNSNQDPANGGDGNEPPAGTPPANQGAGDSNVDLKSLEADKLNDVFENENLWKHPRFQKLAADSQELKKLQDKQRADDEKRLKEENKHQELAERYKGDLEKANETIRNKEIDQALTNKLVPEGVVDLEAALKLANRSDIKITDDGKIEGVAEVITALKTDKAYLFGKPGQPKVGGPTNPENQPSGPAKFKRSQLRDPAFYNEHRKEILEAQKQGLIEDDITGKTG